MSQTTASSLIATPFDSLPEEFGAREADWITFRQDQLRKVRIPVPRPRIAARIDDLAELIGGGSDPLYSGPYNSLVGARLPQARIIILGTACRRPLLWEEARELQEITGDNVLVLRLEEICADDAFTFDLFDAGSRECVPDLSLWAHGDGSSPWLAPSVRSALWVQLLIDGVRTSTPPSDNPAVLQKGFEVARAILPASGSGSHRG